MKERTGKQNVGNAGEYYIAARLSAENFIVTITLGRAEKYDIIAVSPDDKTIKISVKTRLEKKEKRFPLSKKDEMYSSTDCFYAFVRLNEFRTEPDFWIIPSIRVAEVLAHSSNIYFKEKKQKNGEDHNDVGIRNLWIESNKTSHDLFPNNWFEELLGYSKNFDILNQL